MDHQDVVICTHGSVPRAVPRSIVTARVTASAHTPQPTGRLQQQTCDPSRGQILFLDGEKEGGVAAGQVARLCSPEQAPPGAESLNWEDKGRGCTLWSLRGESDSGRYRHGILGFSGIKMALQAGHGGSSL